jgi:hypothetical protein
MTRSGNIPEDVDCVNKQLNSNISLIYRGKSKKIKVESSRFTKTKNQIKNIVLFLNKLLQFEAKYMLHI